MDRGERREGSTGDGFLSHYKGLRGKLICKAVEVVRNGDVVTGNARSG